MKSKTSKKGAALVLAAALTLSLQTAGPLAAVSSGENAQAEQTAQENQEPIELLIMTGTGSAGKLRMGNPVQRNPRMAPRA